MALIKRREVTVIDPGSPATPGREAGEFWCLPPPPPGYQYRPNPAPKGWSPLERIPSKPCSNKPMFYPVDELTFGATALPYGCYAGQLVYKDGKLIGLMMSCVCRTPPKYTDIPPGATRVSFHEYPRHPNGYPIGDGPFTGTVNINGTLKKSVWHKRPGDGALIGGNAAGGVMLVVKTPRIQPKPARPPVIHENYFYGWNAGADSKQRLDGDAEAQWRVDAFKAAVGFAADGTKVDGDYKKLSHAWYIDTDDRGSPRATPMEFGQLVGAARKYNPNTEFGLRRVAGVVTYLMDGAVEHVSMLSSSGQLQLSAAMFRGGDGVF